jgi:hypothetical protein
MIGGILALLTLDLDDNGLSASSPGLFALGEKFPTILEKGYYSYYGLVRRPHV